MNCPNKDATIATIYTQPLYQQSSLSRQFVPAFVTEDLADGQFYYPLSKMAALKSSPKRSLDCGGGGVQIDFVTDVTLTAETASALTAVHGHYGELAGRVEVARIHHLISKGFAQFAETAFQLLDGAIIHNRDYDLSYQTMKHFQSDYLLRYDGIIRERPQQMFMRIAVVIGGEDLQCILSCYEELSTGSYANAPQTLFRAGTTRSLPSAMRPVDNEWDWVNFSCCVDGESRLGL
ncbi:hypothetical protein K474DRAFT_1680491 [Panus rudis PR-1116 ss-1]|nr:hypothetical protein K474DRAFT_1680491 [Panus rudis PR-1116 ss-1]